MTQFTATPNVLVVHPSIPAKSVQELIALAKRRPGSLISASAGFTPLSWKACAARSCAK